ncbi:hypothetical protein ACTA71_003863 [Dictyostelium dimigraforme]
MRFIISLLFIFTLIFNIAISHIGIDVSSGTDVSGFECFKGKKYSRAIIRCYESIGAIDTNCRPSIENAKKAGIETIDVYLFPCYSCGNPEGQVSATSHYLKDHLKDLDFLWLDIEGPGQYWSSSESDNKKFIQGLLDASKTAGFKNVGIYTSESQWPGIVGSWDGGKDYPIWYANYDGAENFDDFRGFNGWTKPHMKQYAGNINECGFGIDKNYWE